jgi:opacity protein-like surface antigen
MLLRFAAAVCAIILCGPASAACVGQPYDQLDFWLGAWHDPAAPATEHYTVTRTAGGCAVEEVLTGADGQTQGIGLSGWDSQGNQWRQLWVDKDRIVTTYLGGPAADGTFVLTSEPKAGGIRWRYTYRNIRPNGVDADYASRTGEGGPWKIVWSGHFDRIGPAAK